MQSGRQMMRRTHHVQLQSPTPLKITLYGEHASYQLKITCPQCGGEGYSVWNMIDLKVMLKTPLCWAEDCCFCNKRFYANNGHPDVCRPCLNYLTCIESGVAVVELVVGEGS